MSPNPSPFGSTPFGSGSFSNAPFYNTKTLIDAVLQNTGHSKPETEIAKRKAVLNFLNNRYSVISTTQHWDWLYQEIDYLFKAPYQDGTINVTEGQQDITGNGTNFNTNLEPYNTISIPSRNETYLIQKINSNVGITLEGQYAGPTTEEMGYKAIKSIYRMPSDLESVQSIQVDNVGELVPMGRQEFTRLKQSLPGQVGMPRCFTEIGRRPDDGVRFIEVYPAPDKNYTVRLFYGVNVTALSDDESSIPLVPDRHRAVLYFGALADMYGYMRDFNMNQAASNDFNLALLNMRNDTKITDSKIQFAQKRNYRNRSNRRKSGQVSYDPSDFAKEG